jgi:hypothetical protein
MNETFQDLLHAFPSPDGGVHTHIMACANKAAYEDVSQDEAVRLISQHMTRPPRPANEVVSSVDKAYAERGKGYAYTPKVMTAAERSANAEALQQLKARRFREMAKDRCTVADLIESSPVDVACAEGFEAFQAGMLLLYMYDRKEVVWCGEQFETYQGVKTVDEWTDIFLDNQAPPPFFVPNPLTGNEEMSKSGKPSFRCDAAVTDYRYALFEVDLPGITLDDQAAFWMRYKEEIPVASITYSGGKSLHALIRVDCRSVEEWDMKVRNGAFRKWEAIGADPACKNPCRLSRLPGHFREGKGLQKLLWLRGGAK